MSRRPRMHWDRGRPFFLRLRSKYLLTVRLAAPLHICDSRGCETRQFLRLAGRSPGPLNFWVYALLLNLRTEKAFGITAPISLLGRADEVIE